MARLLTRRSLESPPEDPGPRIRGVLALMAILTLAAGCSDPPTVVQPDIPVTLGSSRLTIIAGGTVSVTVTVEHETSDEEAVLEILGTPEGVTAAVQPVALTDSSWTLRLHSDATTVPGEYALTVKVKVGRLEGQQALGLTVAPTRPDFSLTLGTRLMEIEQATSGEVSVKVDHVNFADNVRLSVEGVPAGVEAVIDSVATAEGGFTLTIRVAREVFPGPYLLQVIGTSSLGTRSASLGLTVTGVEPDFGLSLRSSSLVVDQGTSAELEVAIARENFTGVVQLEVSGAPAGVLWAVHDSGAGDGVSTITLSVPTSVAPGVYPLRILGSSAVGSRSASLALAVTASNPQFTVTLSASGVGVGWPSQDATRVLVSIARAPGYNEPIELTVNQAPASIGWRFDPRSATGTTSTLILSDARSWDYPQHGESSVVTVVGTSAAGSSSARISVGLNRITAR